MDCLRRIFCCSSGGEFDETMELTAHKKESTVIGTHPVTETIAFLDTKLPKINVTNVTASFAAKLAQCKTTPVPLLGTYNIPFPGTKLVHIIQDTDSTLNIISVQHRPGSGFSGSDACINLHHVFFPNYINENDPGEGKIFSVDIRDIKVNGEEKSNIYGQKVWVHDGRFSPRLTNLIDQMEVGPVVVSTIISLPRLSRDHLYHDVSKIKMLNVILSGEISENIKDYMTIDDLENQLDPDTYLRIRNFTDGVEHY